MCRPHNVSHCLLLTKAHARSSDMWTRRRAGDHNGACCSARTAARCSWVAHAGSVGADPQFHGSKPAAYACSLAHGHDAPGGLKSPERNSEPRSHLQRETGPALLPEACRLIKCSAHVDARAPGSRVEGKCTERRTRWFVVRLMSRCCAAPSPRAAPFRPTFASPLSRYCPFDTSTESRSVEDID